MSRAFLETLGGLADLDSKDHRDHLGLTSNLPKVYQDREVPKENQETRGHPGLMETLDHAVLWGTGALLASLGSLESQVSPDLVVLPSKASQEKTVFPACPEIGGVRDLRGLRAPLGRRVSRASTSWDLLEKTEGPEETEGPGSREYAETQESQATKEPPVEACDRWVPSVPWAFRESKGSPALRDVQEGTARTASLGPEATTAAPVRPESPESAATEERTAGQDWKAHQDTLEIWAHQETRESPATREGPVSEAFPAFLDQTALMG